MYPRAEVRHQSLLAFVYQHSLLARVDSVFRSQAVSSAPMRWQIRENSEEVHAVMHGLCLFRNAE